MDKRQKVILCALGIFFSYFFYGIMQEKVLKSQYTLPDGVETEPFNYATSLVCFLCITSLVISKIAMLTVYPEGNHTVPQQYFAASALTYILAMICTNMSLQFVNYPTQVIAKSCKPIPVMLLGVFLAKKSYNWKKYCSVFMVVCGVALFMYKDKKTSTKGTEDMGFGEVLLFLSLLMDGLTSSVQEYIRAMKITTLEFMYHINLWSTIYLVIGLLLSGEASRFIPFLQRHPDVIWKLLLLGTLNATGQIFIFTGVIHFGPLPVSLITTVRKFFTVLTSVLLFGNTLLTRQWFATFIVFSGLTLDTFYGKSPPKTQ